jgi:hypothetical protein
MLLQHVAPAGTKCHCPALHASQLVIRMANGVPRSVLLPTSCHCSAKRQGSTLTFSLLDPSGQYLSWRAAAHAMMEAGLHVSGWLDWSSFSLRCCGSLLIEFSMK